MDHLPPHLRKTIFEKLYKVAEYAKLTKEEQKMYDQDLKRKWDNAAVLAQAEETGEARGEARGIAKGEKKGRLEVAKSLKKESVSIDIIAKATGFSVEEIEKL